MDMSKVKGGLFDPNGWPSRFAHALDQANGGYFETAKRQLEQQGPPSGFAAAHPTLALLGTALDRANGSHFTHAREQMAHQYPASGPSSAHPALSLLGGAASDLLFAGSRRRPPMTAADLMARGTSRMLSDFGDTPVQPRSLSRYGPPRLYSGD